MKEDYQKNNAAAAAAVEAAMPEAVTIALIEIADPCVRACWPWPWAPACR